MTLNAGFNEGVNVVGHPVNGTKQVIDNAFVRYPYRVPGSTRRGLRRLVSGATDQAFFDRFYQKCDAISGDWRYRSPPVRWGGRDDTANSPTLGFRANEPDRRRDAARRGRRHTC